MYKTIEANRNFASNLFDSIEYALQQLEDTAYVGLPIKSVNAPDSQHEICIFWDDKDKALGICEAFAEGKNVHCDFQTLNDEQVEEVIFKLMLIFNAVVHDSIEHRAGITCQ